VVLALRALQHIADQATGIAQEVIYIVTGETVKHHLDEFRPAKEDE
jgi:phosphate uptake regulator